MGGNGLPDDRLLELLRTAPSEGMEALLAQYTGLVWTIVHQKLTDVEDVKECVNDVFLEFYRQREQVDLRKGSVSSYLGIIARNQAVSRWRKLMRTVETSPDREPAGEDLIRRAEERLDLERAVSSLSPEDAEIILRKYRDGMTAREIAAALSLPYETVKKRHQRILGRLRHFFHS